MYELQKLLDFANEIIFISKINKSVYVNAHIYFLIQIFDYSK